MQLNIAICDDNTKDIDVVKRTLESYSFLRDIDFDISTYNSGAELLNSIRSGKNYEVIILDIEMPNENGISIAGIIQREISYNAIIIFISNYPSYMMDSFKVHPYQFIQKPINKSDIVRTMDDILYDINHKYTIVTLIDGFSNEYSVKTNDIYCIETIDAKNKVLSFNLYDKAIQTKGLLSIWESKLKNLPFIKCNRNILINLEHIHTISENTLTLDNGMQLTLSKRRKKIILDNYLNRIVAIKKGI